MRITSLLKRVTPVGLLLSGGVGLAPGAPAGQTQAFVQGNTAFALDLYSRLKSPAPNVFFSPYSISTCLAMTYGGARGDTAKQMAEVLHFNKDPRKVHASFGELQRQLNEAGRQQGIQLSVANALWAQQGHAFLPPFLNIARGQYQASLNQADFKTGAEPARAEINRWVAKQTQERIKDILPPGSVDALTRLVLANAIYFKGSWAVPFPAAATRPLPFHLSATNQVQAPLMHHVDSFGYMEDSDLQAVELPYSGNELSMVVLLPRRMDGCGDLESPADSCAALRGVGAIETSADRSSVSRGSRWITARPQRPAGKDGHARRLRPESGLLRHGWHEVALHLRRIPQGLGRGQRSGH